MKVTKEKTENCQAYLTVEMEPAEVEASMDKTFRKLVQVKRVPGFRVGKTPRNIFEKYYTRKNLLEDTLEDLLPDAYKKAVAEQQIEPIANPQLELTQMEPVIFKAIIPLKPEVKLSDYHQIKVAEEPPHEVTDEDVNKVLDSLRHEHATWEPADREVKAGDLITMDIWSEVDGKAYINQKGAQYTVKVEDTFPVKGFAEQLTGMKKDEEKEFSLDFAADDPRTELAGKTGKFKIRMNEIKEEKLPEINDEFAKSISKEYETVEKLRGMARDRLVTSTRDIAKSAFEEKALDAVVKESTVEFPDVMTDAEIHRMMDERFQTHEQFEAYVKSVNKTEEQVHTEFHEQAHEIAAERVKRSLVLGKLSDEEKLEVTPADIDADIERMLKDITGQNRDDLLKSLNKPEVRDSISQRLLARKTIDKLVEIVRVPAPPAEPQQEKPAEAQTEAPAKAHTEKKAEAKSAAKSEAKPKSKSKAKKEE
jgi:trigger factor